MKRIILAIGVLATFALANTTITDRENIFTVKYQCLLYGIYEHAEWKYTSIKETIQAEQVVISNRKYIVFSGDVFIYDNKEDGDAKYDSYYGAKSNMAVGTKYEPTITVSTIKGDYALSYECARK